MLGIGIFLFFKSKNQNGEKLFAVGVRNPAKRDTVVKKLQIADAFCATSGNYERFSVIKGKRYSHIMNPLTGSPVQNMYSATVITERGIDSDIYSSSCFILGENWANSMVNKKKLKGVYLPFLGY